MSGGGGIQSAGSDTIITGCTISGNTATVFGGGISCDAGGSPTITNCIVTNNWSQYGGGLYLLESSPTITSCTIADNDGDNGKALFVQGFPLVSNCILWGGEPVEAPVIYGITDYLIVNYSNIQMANPDEVWPGGGNINADPLFVGTNDYHLADGSPCIDAGLDVGVYTDFDGDSRPQGSGFDMGADEVVSATPPCFIGMVM
jgi:predicted outer membrane repeat protein